MKSETLEKLLEAEAARRPVVLATNLDTGAEHLIERGAEGEGPVADAARDAFRSDRSRAIETPDGAVFLNVQNPPLRLVIVGAVHIAQALIPVAELAGFAVTVIDPRGAFATGARFPNVDLYVEWPDEVLDETPPDSRTAMVALTHDPKIDDPALSHALRSEAFYIGALGSKKTHGGRVERLTGGGFGPDDIARIHGPIGLPIGARSPAEIAVAIMAEIINTLRQGSAAA